jgi:DNA polymerase family B
LINLKFSWKPYSGSNELYTIDFRDSLLMLPNSLMKLAKAFKIENKGIFPYDFVSNNLDYIGEVPAFNYFNNISSPLGEEDYNTYKANFKNNWDLKLETIKYCELDCKILWQIIETFNDLIFDKYSLNIHRFPTLPSLAFGIFRAHYLLENTIPKLSGQMYHDIRSGYTGGHTDVYETYGEDISCYDVNSLYPTAMKTFTMPVGNITYFEGNILAFNPNPFGFFEVEVTAPKDLHRPLLQTKVKTNSGMRTVAPLGTWTDMIFSQEMFEYLKYGYTFKVNRGYLFDQGNIFDGYVQDLYKIKEAEPKDSPMYLISKLLLNSLYGRFGMTPYLIDNNVMDNFLLEEFISNKELKILDCIDLNNGKSLISFDSNNNILSLESNANVSISIAAAITSYARIHMSQFLGDPSLQILYTDTDSAYIKGKLDPKYIGTGLGQMKLEYTFKEAVFLAPKVYGGILTNGQELTKVKGFKNVLPYSELKTLLTKNNKLELNQDKWYRSISDGSILIKNSLYTLIATENR